ncbi:redoxin domain-containing protein [Silvibacterium sp.]|uniref:redoxin domain-containing protein n=1 Tax=Silvibacterium sp. TaxID=1964179 RepID=UPI0039E46508
MRRTCLSFIVLLSTPLWAQTSNTLPGCTTPPAIQKTLHDKLEGPAFERLSFLEQETLRRTVLTELAAQYPREIAPKKRLISIAQREEEALHPGSWAAFQANYRQQAKDHPNDPLVLYLAAVALNGTDTPESIRLLNAAKAQAPQFVWPDLQLAQIYSRGKFEDRPKFEEHLTAYWTACPASTDGFAQWMLVKDMTLQAKVAAALRPQLEKETDPEALKDYRYLWSLEFRTHPPQEHEAIRKQVAVDVKRLETANPHPDAEWANFLIDGYKQSGATQETLNAMQDKLLQQYPQSDEAESIVQKRWNDAHKEPTDEKDAAAWTAYRKAHREVTKEWIREYPNDVEQARTGMLYNEFGDDSLPEKEGIAIVDAYLAAGERQDQPGWIWSKYYAADFLMDHKWQPARAADLFQQVAAMQASNDARAPKSDNLTADEQKDNDKQKREMAQSIRSELIHAALLAKEPNVVIPLKASIEVAPPDDKKELSGYWLDRARFAVLENQKQDALTFYQQALQTRAKAPTWQQGKLSDDVLDESKALWTEMGGTETAFVVWSKPPGAPVVDASEARWEKPTKTLPDFQLTDLSGKTWTTANLKGKVVLINLWATWCGPCNAELPHLQKLYEQIKGRSDIQILTFNIDEDEGLVAPFLKEKGYTFPVLPAYSYTVNLLNGYAIPQSWVLNPQGSWQWTQIGFDATDNWSQGMIEKLEATKSGS